MVNTSNSHFGQRKKNIIPEIGPINHKIGVKINKKFSKKINIFLVIDFQRYQMLEMEKNIHQMKDEIESIHLTYTFEIFMKVTPFKIYTE